MDCEIFRILYLRANGELPCNCALGEAVNLGWLTDAPDWDIDAHFASPRFEKMRSAFAASELPWGDTCANCVFLRRGEPFRGGPLNRHIEKLHVEPSLACALRCPGCSRVRQAATRTGTTFLVPELYERLLRQLAEKHYSLGFFYFCGQGEPVSHPEMPRLLEISRLHFPRSARIINTNGNYRYADCFPGETADRFIVSVDGARQGSYEQYRVRGDIRLAIDFMRDAKRARPAPIVEWKYILFTYNDSDEEILEAQRIADDLGIDALQFVLTHTPERSTRYTHETLDHLPLASPLAYVESTPHLYHKRRHLRALATSDSRQRDDFPARDRLWCVLDEAWIMGSQFGIRGWLHVRNGGALRSLGVSVDGHSLGKAVHGTPRPDVLDALPEVGSYRVGFRLTSPLPALGATAAVALVIALDDGSVHTLNVPYAVNP